MRLFERQKTFLTKFLAPGRFSVERRADPRYRAPAHALVSWRDGECNGRIPVRLIDISRGGAAIEVDDVFPSSSFVRLYVGGEESGDRIEAEVLSVTPTDGKRTLVRLKFRRRCARSLLELVVLGRRPHREPRHNPFAGIEALEGRQLLSTGLVYPKIAVPAQIDTTTSTLTHTAHSKDFFHTAALHKTPDQMVRGYADDGAGRRPDHHSRHPSVAGLGSGSRQLPLVESVTPPIAVPAQSATTTSTSTPAPVSPTIAVAAPSATTTSTLTLAAISNDPFLASVLYSTPSRMASDIAADGAVGDNATWESGQSSSWYIEEQRYGADFVQAGLVTGNTSLVQQGWQILNWGFNKEAADGSFPGTGDAFHSTSMFVEAGARALLLEVQMGAPDAAQLVAKYLPKINASAQWLMTPSVAAAGNANDAPYTHRRYLLAAALGEVAALTGDPATTAAAEVYAENGLALQTADGMNPEKGGGDVSYQDYGILLAERYETVCPNAALKAEIQSMIVKGLQWDETYISATGQVSLAGSTQTGVGTSRSGTTKTIDYKTMVQAFSLATTLTGDPSYRVVAEAVAAGRGWTST